MRRTVGFDQADRVRVVCIRPGNAVGSLNKVKQIGYGFLDKVRQVGCGCLNKVRQVGCGLFP